MELLELVISSCMHCDLVAHLLCRRCQDLLCMLLAGQLGCQGEADVLSYMLLYLNRTTVDLAQIARSPVISTALVAELSTMCSMPHPVLSICNVGLTAAGILEATDMHYTSTHPEAESLHPGVVQTT